MQLPFMLILAIIYVAVNDDKDYPLSTIFATYDNVRGSIGILFLTLCRTTFWYNVLLLVINLLIPIYPLDGVRIYAAVLKMWGMSLKSTAMFVSIAGLIISCSLFGYGVFKLFSKSYSSGLSEIAGGTFGLVNSKMLFDSVKAGVLDRDPIFGRPCYERENESVEMPTLPSTNSDGGEDTVPVSELV